MRHLILATFLGVLVVGSAYALTPLPEWGAAFLASFSHKPVDGIFLATPSAARQTKSAGAETRSVVDSAATAVPSALAVPTAPADTGRYAFLLMGYGGGNHDGAYLTDSLMVVIVDPAQKTLTLLSLPRDAWVPLTFDGKTSEYNKINTAYAFAQDPTVAPDRLARYTGDQGPGTFASDSVSRLLGIPITYYVGLDFQGFRQMIDAVGGIDVDVPASFAARYPANDDPSIDASWTTVRFQAGMQHLNGEQAIEYARARETIDNSDEGTDFARSRRQRLIIEAFKTRIFQPDGLVHLPQLLAIASQHVDTNYRVPDVAKLSQLALEWKSMTIYQTALTTDNYLEDATGPDGTYLVVPGSPDHSWAQVRAFCRALWKDPAAGVAMANTTIVVENDTGVTGLAGRVSDALLRLGYQVGDPVSGSPRAQSQVVDSTGGKAAPLVQAIGQNLGLANLASVAATAADGPSNQIVLELGADAANLNPVVAADKQAPFSDVGVVKFGVWPYTPPLPTPSPTLERPTPTTVPTPRSAPRPTSTPGHSPAPSSATVVVPSLLGLPEAEAQKLINDAGLATTYVNYQTSSDVADHSYFQSVAPGHVLSQNPPPGQSVPRGSRVNLAVRKS